MFHALTTSWFSRTHSCTRAHAANRSLWETLKIVMEIMNSCNLFKLKQFSFLSLSETHSILLVLGKCHIGIKKQQHIEGLKNKHCHLRKHQYKRPAAVCSPVKSAERYHQHHIFQVLHLQLLKKIKTFFPQNWTEAFSSFFATILQHFHAVVAVPAKPFQHLHMKILLLLWQTVLIQLDQGTAQTLSYWRAICNQIWSTSGRPNRYSTLQSPLQQILRWVQHHNSKTFVWVCCWGFVIYLRQ